MIAPLREPGTVTTERRQLAEARRYVATTLLDRAEENCGPAVAAWKAWPLVGWMARVARCYAMGMLGWW